MTFAAPRPQAGNRGDRLANEAFAGHVGLEKFSHNYIGCDCSHMQIDFDNMQFQYFGVTGACMALKVFVDSDSNMMQHVQHAGSLLHCSLLTSVHSLFMGGPQGGLRLLVMLGVGWGMD